MQELNSTNFDEEVIKSTIPVIIDFWAEWCGPCRMMAPVFEKLSKKYEGKLKFAKVNTDQNSDIAHNFGIRGIPCLVILNHGKEINRIVGFQSEEALKISIDDILKSI